MKINVGVKLTIVFLLILIIGLGAIAYFAYQGVNEGLLDKTDEELKAINDLKGDQIEDYFVELEDSINHLSDFKILRNELPKLTEAYTQRGIGSQEYEQVLTKIEAGVDYFTDNDNWNDIYLIDTRGNVLYSADKSDDFGTNLNSGPYKNSSLAQAYKKGKDQLSFIDFNYYEASENQVGFISAPVVSQEGNLLGVAALEFSINRINTIMHRESGLGEDGESYLVGPDKLMRSDSKFVKENTILTQRIDNKVVDRVLDGESGVSSYINFRGGEVLSSYMPVNIFDQQWGLLVEVDKNHILQPVNELLKKLFYIALGIIILGTIITILFVKLAITNPIHKVRDVLEALSDKDLTQKVDYTSNDEIGEMSADLNSTVNELNDIINEIKETGNSVYNSSEDLAEGNNNLASRTQDVASSLEEVSATVEQISASMQEIASHASIVNDISSDNVEAIEQGSEIIDETKEEIEAMDELSSRISDIIVIINDIAAQTKLLSMNAAIEAAKADQNGEGFAVVATEVGELADETANSAKKINGLIQNIITGINESSEQIKVVDEMFDEIVENSNKVYQGVDQISASTEEQSSAVEQMQEALEELNLSTQRNTNLVEDIAQSSEDLNEDANKLDELVDKFEISEGKNSLLDLLKQGKLNELKEEELEIDLEQLTNLSN